MPAVNPAVKFSGPPDVTTVSSTGEVAEVRARRSPSLVSGVTNHTALREMILKRLAFLRPHLAKKKTRVSPDVIRTIEAEIRVLIDRKIQAMPTTGRTITF